MAPRRFLRFAEDGLATILDLRRSPPPSASQTALARQLAADLDGLVSAGRQGEASEFWQGICAELSRLAETGDPMYFMRWPPIGATMVHGAVPATLRMWWALRRSPAWHSVWAPALRHPQFGHPPPFAPMLSTNAMAIEHAFHLLRFQRQFGTHLHDADCIIEIGGGFGSMCRLIRAMGFRGRYIIFDLPTILALQRYYLGLHGASAGDDADADVWLCPDLDRIAAWLERARPARVSLMSTWALSEIPLGLRERIETFLKLQCVRNALFAYQPTFEGIDNRAYFHDLRARAGDRWSWSEAPVDPSGKPAMPSDSLYLFGQAG